MFSNPLLGAVVEPSAGSVVELVRERVARTPEAIAVIHEQEEYSFGDLWRRVLTLAAELRRAGVRRGAHVAVWAERRPDIVAVMLAAMLLEAPYIPIDPAYPPERIRDVLETAEPVLLVCDGSLDGDHATPIFDTAAVRQVIDDESYEFPATDAPAYIMFTSGTQGRPKGVVVTHRALLNYSSWCADTFCRDGSGGPLFASLGFDHSITCLWPVLISGGSIVLVPGIWDLRAVLERRPRRFDFIKATPSHIRFFERLYRPNYGELTGALMFGGEPLDPILVDQCADRLAGIRLINHYGPTEATVGCLYHEFVSGAQDRYAGVPIGRPIWNMRAYVVDQDLRPVAERTIGELVVAGAGVADGYLGMAGTSGFIDESLVGGPPGRAYRTGDLVEITTDGALLYRGRLDGQLKVSGYRIESADIRRHLLSLAGVTDVAVQAAGDASASLDVHIATMLPAIEYDELGSRAKAVLRQILPRVIVPRTVRIVTEIGADAHGKQDLSAADPAVS